jgi:hypothetical protein
MTQYTFHRAIWVFQCGIPGKAKVGRWREGGRGAPETQSPPWSAQSLIGAGGMGEVQQGAAVFRFAVARSWGYCGKK